MEASELLARSGQVSGYDGTGSSKKGMGTPAKECSCGVKGAWAPLRRNAPVWRKELDAAAAHAIMSRTVTRT